MDLEEFYREVAQSLIKDGVTGLSEEEIVQKLMSDTDNPFQPMSEEEILHRLEHSDQQYREGKYRTLEEAFAALRKEN